MWTKDFWKDTGERAIATFVQAFLAVLSVGALTTAVQSQDWSNAWGVLYVSLAAGGIAALLSLVKAVAASYTGEKGTAQLGIATYKEE